MISPRWTANELTVYDHEQRAVALVTMHDSPTEALYHTRLIAAAPCLLMACRATRLFLRADRWNPAATREWQTLVGAETPPTPWGLLEYVTDAMRQIEPKNAF